MRISDKKEKSHDQFIELLTIRKTKELIFGFDVERKLLTSNLERNLESSDLYRNEQELLIE